MPFDGLATHADYEAGALLRKTRDLLSNPSRWTRNVVCAHHPSGGFAYCLAGALAKAIGICSASGYVDAGSAPVASIRSTPAFQYLCVACADLYGYGWFAGFSPVVFNDNVGDHHQVMAALDAAIELAERPDFAAIGYMTACEIRRAERLRRSAVVLGKSPVLEPA